MSAAAASSVATELPDFRVRRIAGLLRGYRYLFADEYQLQETIARVLSDAGESVMRERILDRRNRADVTTADGIVIEVKIEGSLSAALRQCERYSALDAVHGVVLAASVSWARRGLVSRPRMGGKPFAMIYLARQSL
ncbi:MAG TPA: hypothetical protein VF284_12335 [Rhodanobacteraceae bacterium]